MGEPGEDAPEEVWAIFPSGPRRPQFSFPAFTARQDAENHVRDMARRYRTPRRNWAVVGYRLIREGEGVE